MSKMTKSQLEVSSVKTANILIVGGYGEIGRGIAQRLSALFPNRVYIAGRNLDKAKAVALEIGNGVQARYIDIFSKNSIDALDNIGLAIVCIDQNNTYFVEQCLTRNINYMDVSADYSFFSQVVKLDNLAKENSATVVLSVGVAPGLTNLLAARAKEKLSNIKRLDIVIELGLGDKHGRAAIEWMLDNLDVDFEITENGQSKRVKSFGDKIVSRLLSDEQSRPAYRFNFCDQFVLPRTLNVPSVSTWIRFDTAVATFLFAKLVQLGFGKLLKWQWLKKATVWLLMNLHLGSDTTAIAVHATGLDEDILLSLRGRKEGIMTAIAATQTAQQILKENFSAGVFHSEELIALDPIITALKVELSSLKIKEIL